MLSSCYNLRMLLLEAAISIILLELVFGFTIPPGCNYNLDEKGRHLVVCDEGGLEGPLDVTKVDASTEILRITAPPENPNTLIIGPIFDSLQKLQELEINHCNIPEIGPNTFWYLSKLEYLSLRDNNISTVLDHNFKGLVGLKRLDLSNNRIERLVSGTFRHLTALTALSLARNRLHELVTRVFEKLSKLQELNLSGNRLYEFNPEVFVDIQDIKVLECRNCGLTTLNPNVLTQVPRLATLDLGNNAIQEITSEHLAVIPELTALWLDSNKLTQLDACIFGMQSKLKKLNIAKNHLTYLPPDFYDNTTRLTDLDVSYNSLTELQPFQNTLQSLDISGNSNLQTEDLKIVFKETRHLQRLSLSNMKLYDSDLPLGLFDFNSELIALNLSKNRLTVFPVGILSPTARLDELDLSENRIRGLDNKGLLRLEAITYVSLSKNPWACDLCYVGSILTVMNRSQTLQDIICFSPKVFRGRRLDSLRMQDLAPCGNHELLYEDENGFDESGLGIIAAGAGIFLLVLTITALLAAVCYTRRHHADYYTHEESRTDHDPMFDGSDVLFSDHGELNFKFPTDTKISVSTIDEIAKNDPDLQIKR